MKFLDQKFRTSPLKLQKIVHIWRLWSEKSISVRGFELFGGISSKFFKWGNRINKGKIPLFDPIPLNFNVPLFGLTIIPLTTVPLFSNKTDRSYLASLILADFRLPTKNPQFKRKIFFRKLIFNKKPHSFQQKSI